ncbi:MAG: hypothetical protein KC912_01270 [Proteobacteria bacterium]|nr:hypothetical protein [Pseudomonadota bacterium]
MKPTSRERGLDQLEWRIGMQTWDLRAPRWLPDPDAFASPMVSLGFAVGGALIGVALGMMSVVVGPPACGASTMMLGTAAFVFAVGVLPRHARFQGPQLLLTLGPTHLDIGVDWPGAPADRLAATLAGLSWSDAGGRRIPWAELRGARLAKNRNHLELRLRSGETLKLPVAGSRHFNHSLKDIAKQLEAHARRVGGGHVPRELQKLRKI